jgi:hypothetical protein
MQGRISKQKCYFLFRVASNPSTATQYLVFARWLHKTPISAKIMPGQAFIIRDLDFSTVKKILWPILVNSASHRGKIVRLPLNAVVPTMSIK